NSINEEATLPTVPPAPGQPLGKVAGYEVLEELGRGGMGVVYKARQVNLNRLVALKMILGGGLAGQEERDRLRVEAEALAQLQNPNIVQIFEIGEHGGLPFFSLEYVGGGTLARKLNGKPQPFRESAILGQTLARAMHAAHACGILHRGLKPANILLSGGIDPPLSQCVPKITDFGLAKQLNLDESHTQSGAIVGTPYYMAPEQAWGKTNVNALGAPVDVY